MKTEKNKDEELEDDVVVEDENLNEDEVVVEESVSALEALKVLVEENEAFDEPFLERVETIFQSGLATAVKAKESELEKANEEKLAQLEESLTDKVDAYLTYAVEHWIEENEVAIDEGIKVQISEDFLVGLKNLFSEQYVELPEGKTDLYEDAVAENATLNEKLNEIESDLAKYKETCESFTRKEIFTKVSEGMSDTDKERFESLIESVEFENTEKYESKLGILRKAFIDKTDDSTVTEDKDDSSKLIVEDLSGGEDDDDSVHDPLVASVLAALNKK